MANEKHQSILRQVGKIWNDWREEHPEIKPDLSEADLVGANLAGGYFRGADLRGANLKATDLRGQTSAGRI
jgi:uncharacterized protein YjbI with pentapeptide repeats